MMKEVWKKTDDEYPWNYLKWEEVDPMDCKKCTERSEFWKVFGLAVVLALTIIGWWHQ